ncbi:MAG: hypothetical protein RBR48_03240 [Bacilli bacterium]|jgi:hypothetical protein|nr:hypothetical protein [Bacilli bacterium]
MVFLTENEILALLFAFGPMMVALNLIAIHTWNRVWIKENRLALLFPKLIDSSEIKIWIHKYVRFIWMNFVLLFFTIWLTKNIYISLVISVIAFYLAFEIIFRGIIFIKLKQFK